MPVASSIALGTMSIATSRWGRPAASIWLPSRPEQLFVVSRSGGRNGPTPAAAVPAAAGGGGSLVDPAAGGPRRVVVPQRMDPSLLEDVRKAEASGPRVSSF